MRSWGLALAAALAACGPTGAKTAATLRPIGEDPLQILPSGADLVMDVDVEQLRAWEPTVRFVKVLPEAAQARLLRLGFDPIFDVEAAWISVAGLGTPEAQATVIVRGDLDPAKVRAALGDGAQTVDWRGVQLAEAGDDAFAKVTPRLFVLGSPADVRRVIDLVQREASESVRTQDAALVAAFQRAPTAKEGRPAVMLGLVPPEALRDRLEREALPGGQLEWLAASLAVGDGFDVGGVAGVRDAREAAELVVAARRRVEAFCERPAVRALGLAAFVEPVTFKAREANVYFAYRLPRRPVDRLLGRLESLNELARAKPRRGRLDE